MQGMPVLYVPGNAGSGKQVRSLAAKAAQDLSSGIPGPELDFFAVATPSTSLPLLAAPPHVARPPPLIRVSFQYRLTLMRSLRR